MEHSNCLNCKCRVQGKFCHNCGQRADTHRITIKHFVMHDLMHGVWHLEKGILFTLKEVFVRPGFAALDYIEGKRIKYYNVFYLLLLLMGLYMFISGHADIEIEKLDEANYANPAVIKIIKAYSTYFKYFLLLFIPLMATGGLVVFQKLKLNFWEHLIIVGFAGLGSIALLVLSALIANVSNILELLLIFSSCFYLVRSYYQVTRGLYTFLGFAWRIIFLYFLLLFLYTMLLGVILITYIL